MLLSELLQALPAEWAGGDGRPPEIEFSSCFAADLMSEVLAFCAPGALLVTGLASVQSVHTADVAELKGILLVNGKQPGAEMRRLAEQRAIPILTTRLPMYAACGILYARGLAPAVKS